MSMIYGYDSQTVQRRRFLKPDAYGKPVYREPEDIACRLQDDRRLVRDGKGEIVVSEGVLYTTAEIRPLDTVVIDGRERQVIAVSRKVDLDGCYDHTEVRL